MFIWININIIELLDININVLKVNVLKYSF